MALLFDILFDVIRAAAIRFHLAQLHLRRPALFPLHGLHGGLEASHTLKPAAGIGRAIQVVTGDFRVRQDQEPFLGEGFHDTVGHELRGDSVLKQKRAGSGIRGVEHGGAHALGTERGDADAVVTVGDREPRPRLCP